MFWESMLLSISICKAYTFITDTHSRPILKRNTAKQSHHIVRVIKENISCNTADKFFKCNHCCLQVISKVLKILSTCTSSSSIFTLLSDHVYKVFIRFDFCSNQMTFELSKSWKHGEIKEASTYQVQDSSKLDWLSWLH